MKRCHHCWRFVWPWHARFTITNPDLPDLEEEDPGEITFHGECACIWLLAQLNRQLRFKLRRVVAWGK